MSDDSANPAAPKPVTALVEFVYELRGLTDEGIRIVAEATT
jgi:hypothetical protein